MLPDCQCLLKEFPSVSIIPFKTISLTMDYWTQCFKNVFIIFSYCIFYNKEALITFFKIKHFFRLELHVILKSVQCELHYIEEVKFVKFVVYKETLTQMRAVYLMTCLQKNKNKKALKQCYWFNQMFLIYQQDPHEILLNSVVKICKLSEHPIQSVLQNYMLRYVQHSSTRSTMVSKQTIAINWTIFKIYHASLTI